MDDIFPTKNGQKQEDTSLKLSFNFALEYAIRKVRANQDRLKLNGTHQVWVYADYVNTLCGSIPAEKESTEVLAATSEETGLKANTEKTQYTFMSREQNAQQNHNMKTSNKYSENVVKFKYLETTPTNQNCMHKHLRAD